MIKRMTLKEIKELYKNDSFISDWIDVMFKGTDYAFITIAPKECVCGADTCKTTHANWCPKYREE